MVVDPAVSRTKFDREVALFRRHEDTFRKRGWWLLKSDFPVVVIAFVTPQLIPRSVVFGARLDFTDYDLHPPSVRLIDPLSDHVYLACELPVQLKRQPVTPTKFEIPPELEQHLKNNPGAQIVIDDPAGRLMQFWGPNDVPFLCLPGVREYHENPAHTGDSWLLHRGTGEGTLIFIVEQLSRYGLEPITSYGITISGYRQRPPPP